MAVVVASSDALVRAKLTALMEAAGCLAIAARHGGEVGALPHMLKRRGREADLIILDLAIENWAGLAVCGLLRAGGYTGPIMALVTGSSQTPRGQQTCFDAGCSSVLLWPDEADGLVGKCERLVASCSSKC